MDERSALPCVELILQDDRGRFPIDPGPIGVALRLARRAAGAAAVHRSEPASRRGGCSAARRGGSAGAASRSAMASAHVRVSVACGPSVARRVEREARPPARRRALRRRRRERGGVARRGRVPRRSVASGRAAEPSSSARRGRRAAPRDRCRAAGSRRRRGTAMERGVSTATGLPSTVRGPRPGSSKRRDRARPVGRRRRSSTSPNGSRMAFASGTGLPRTIASSVGRVEDRRSASRSPGPGRSRSGR